MILASFHVKQRLEMVDSSLRDKEGHFRFDHVSRETPPNGWEMPYERLVMMDGVSGSGRWLVSEEQAMGEQHSRPFALELSGQVECELRTAPTELISTT